MTGGGFFRKAKKVICRGASSCITETDKTPQASSPQTQSDSQAGNEYSGTERAGRHSVHISAQQSTQQSDGIWLIDLEGTPIRRRGRTTCTDIQNMTPGTRVYIAADDVGILCNIPESILLSSYLGVIARDPMLAPINFSGWRNKGMEPFKKKMIAEIERKFVISDHVRTWVLKSLGVKWRNYKTSLKAEYFDSRPLDEIMEDIPTGVDASQWCQLVSQWSQPSYKEQACEICNAEGLKLENKNMEANERVFSLVKGPEHDGRARVARFGVTPTKYFPHSTSMSGQSSRNSSDFEKIDRIEKEFKAFKDESRTFQYEIREFMHDYRRRQLSQRGLEMDDNDRPSE